jgi:hypothetical protein
MIDEHDELSALAQEIQKIIADNRKFLERVQDEDFEPIDEEDVVEDGITEEL